MGGNVEKKKTKRERGGMKGYIKEINSLEERKVLTCKMRQDIRRNNSFKKRRTKISKKERKMLSKAAFI